MTTEELESKLEAGTETQTIEFKGACSWNEKIFAKDILAMSNVQDGGFIIVGVKQLDDGTFEREGITEEIKKSYKIDKMKDQMKHYADPYVDFKVDFPKDRNGKEYAVIRVFPFNELPVICKKDSEDIKAGVIYYRNRNRRIESAPVSNSYDMKDIIEIATVKMMQRKTELGFTVKQLDYKEKFEKELGGMKKDLLEKIKKRGYWRINFQPLVYIQKFTSLNECKDIVEKNTVKLGGWDYPHFPISSGDDEGLEPGENFYRGWIDWEHHKEFWQMYQSGQFIHYLALWEDWIEESFIQYFYGKIEPFSSLGIIGSVIYQMTEIFEFLSRLGRAGIYDKGVFVSIALHNTKNRKLWTDVNKMRAPFFRSYKTAAQKIEIVEKFTKEQIITSSKDLAFEVIKRIFDKFGWDNPPIETIKKDQDDLLSGKI